MLSLIALLVSPLLVTAERSPTPPHQAHYKKAIAGWAIEGASDVNTCIAVPQRNNPLGFHVNLVASRSAAAFGISNPAWKSLSGDAVEISATFWDSRGKVTGVKRISGQSHGAAPYSNPSVTWPVDAPADGKPLIDWFSNASKVSFDKGAIRLGSLNIANAHQMIEALLECRRSIRSSIQFDPFAG